MSGASGTSRAGRASAGRAALLAATAVTAAACLAACGTQRPGAAPSVAPTSSAGSSPSPASPHAEPDRGDSAPHNAENNIGRMPGDMTPADEAAAKEKAEKIKPVLEKLRKQGRISPQDVRPALAGLGFRAADMRVQDPWSRWNVDHSEKVPGTFYGIWVGKTACISGAVSKDTVWVEVNGPYPETACIVPPVAH
ncbi:hypothetical protein GCM10011579_052960 [Streptomyces albiflavescens]|uniref:Lipoprotein n=2 Tax=Streptomyces albiflavescens TaxID=1623582 RepID=A0A917Y7X2_9ACTN|nr:hypothetical protein GCM10011579_052960 [Streptomyces albiflavescens]